MANEVLEFGPADEYLGFTSEGSTRVVAIGIFRLFISYGANQDDVIFARRCQGSRDRDAIA